MPDRIVIMQPYFVPYAGYFRLFAASDLFVIYDDVQFPRAGYVHRNRLPDTLGRSAWLTLPLVKSPVVTPIDRMIFAADCRTRFELAMRRFPALAKGGTHPLLDALRRVKPGGGLVDYLAETLLQSCATLKLPCNVIRSSSLVVEPGLRGVERLIAITRLMGAKQFVNASGGRQLYEMESFRRHGIRLRFLDDYRGPNWSILYRLLTESPATLRREIFEQV